MTEGCVGTPSGSRSDEAAPGVDSTEPFEQGASRSPQVKGNSDTERWLTPSTEGGREATRTFRSIDCPADYLTCNASIPAQEDSEAVLPSTSTRFRNRHPCRKACRSPLARLLAAALTTPQRLES